MSLIPSASDFKEKIRLDQVQSGASSQMRHAFGSFGREFREFIARGNVVDLAVGVSVGTAFSSLVQSFVQNIVSPPLRLMSSAIVGAAHTAQASATGLTGFDWTPPQNGPGAFLGQLGSFGLLSLSVFVMVKIMNRFKQALEKRALAQPADAQADPSHEDTATRLIAQNDRIIALLEQLNAKGGAAASTDNHGD